MAGKDMRNFRGHGIIENGFDVWTIISNNSGSDFIIKFQVDSTTVGGPAIIVFVV